LSAKGAFSILDRNSPVLRLLARGDEPIELVKRAAIKSPKFGDPDLTFAAFVALREIQAGTPPIEAIERAVAPSLGTSARAVLIYNIAAVVDANMRPKPKSRATATKRVETRELHAAEAW
jgi:hypothetical protein